MEKRKLGNGGLEVSALGLGCMGLTFSYDRPISKKEGISLIHAAIERGVTFFDTNDLFIGTHEITIGNNYRDAVFAEFLAGKL